MLRRPRRRGSVRPLADWSEGETSPFVFFGVIPPVSIPADNLATIKEYTKKIAESLHVCGLMGSPSRFKYTIRSLKEGQTSLQLEYKRPWENNPAIEKQVYEIEVQKNGKMTISQKTDFTSQENSFTSISMAEGLSRMEKSSDFILLDVRRLDEYEEGHIPNATLFTNENMTEEEANRLIPNKKQTIFVYCRTGRRSKQASQKLATWGYENVYDIGGIIDYNELQH